MTIIHKCRTQCVNGVLRRPFKITGLMKFLGGLVILAALGQTVQAASVTLAWNPSTNPIVAGYNLYYGGASGTYTNEVSAGHATSATVTGLIEGANYYFVATAYSAPGAESPNSSEVAYTVPVLARVQLAITPTRQFKLTLTGTIGHVYNVQATQDFKTWTNIGTVTMGTNGLSVFTDTNAASFPRRFYRTQG